MQHLTKLEWLFNYNIKMIQELKISAHSVFLQGMSLNGHFHISNPNKLMAVSFQIEPIFDSSKKYNTEDPDTTSSMASLLNIFPKSGLLLKEQTQRISINAKNREQFDSENFIQGNVKLCVKYSLDNNYNKILIKNGKIKSFPLANYNGHNTITVEVGTDILRLKQQINNQVMFTSIIGRQTCDISQIASSPRKDGQLYTQEETQEVFEIIHSLQLNSKIKEKQISIAYDKQELPIISSKSFEENKIQNITLGLQSARDIPFSFSSQQKNTNQQFSLSKRPKKEVNSFQLLILAICAAFFFSLGSNFSHFLASP